MLLGVDVGGTFTDVVLAVDGRLVTAKYPSTPEDQSEGFTDVVELGRQARADLYRLCAAHPPPLVPAERRVGAPERVVPAGPLRALDEAAAAAVAERVAAAEPE